MGLKKAGRAVIFFFATLLLYLGVTLLGWGLGDLAGYFALGQRTAYAIVVGLFSLAVGIQAYESTKGIRGGAGETGRRVGRQRIVKVVLVLSLYLALFFIPFFDRRGILVINNGFTLRWLGVVMAAIGYALIYWSGLALGRQYSADVTIQNEHQLVTGSIYRHIRHPRYLGVIALTVGFSCVFRSWIGLAASLAVLAALLFRIRDEETLMQEEFGAEWEAYCKTSWRLIPVIY
jgi:protein-S-isoprenylcysteine O-methyltransferase Ste14